ncbi:winged helix-turn-helix domain-containing protein [Methanoculleus sp. 7T]|jgi:DNA-binding transcriptional ArsR family regulator|uniref:winged helix-turn-helix domain-containing protein n=1 Tax=Methanoculleus sp. 7T TaxID=2937282 RepID=UPI0020BE70BB|nr:winged helix-turn-helix domain-containing protein [Methanoculleus sp. 7T]MCK8519614.1 winged helix-turn-helix domain-containing protein [Methanoculleus sp. 7T]
MEPVDIVLTKDTFEVLGPGTRLDILKTLSSRRMTVTELADSQSTVHHHLQRLADAGLVAADDGGHAWVYYALAMIGESRQQRTSLWMRESCNLYTLFTSVRPRSNAFNGLIAPKDQKTVVDTPRGTPAGAVFIHRRPGAEVRSACPKTPVSPVFTRNNRCGSLPRRLWRLDE